MPLLLLHVNSKCLWEITIEYWQQVGVRKWKQTSSCIAHSFISRCFHWICFIFEENINFAFKLIFSSLRWHVGAHTHFLSDDKAHCNKDVIIQVPIWQGKIATKRRAILHHSVTQNDGLLNERVRNQYVKRNVDSLLFSIFQLSFYTVQSANQTIKSVEKDD